LKGGLIEAEISVLDQFLARHTAQIKLWVDRSTRRDARPHAPRKGEGLYAPYERDRPAAEPKPVAGAGELGALATEAAGENVNFVNLKR
jgi:hypothetical protein